MISTMMRRMIKMIMIRREKRQRGSEESLSFVERFDNDEEDENAVDIEKGFE